MRGAAYTAVLNLHLGPVVLQEVTHLAAYSPTGCTFAFC